MVRQFKHHESKLLKKVDFVKWGEGEIRESTVMRKYHIQKRNDYQKYVLQPLSRVGLRSAAQRPERRKERTGYFKLLTGN